MTTTNTISPFIERTKSVNYRKHYTARQILQKIEKPKSFESYASEGEKLTQLGSTFGLITVS